MPKFIVLCRVDAYVDYRAEIQADDAEEAALVARENSSDYQWEEDGPVEFDACGYVTLDKKGNEIEHTRCGYFG